MQCNFSVLSSFSPLPPFFLSIHPSHPPFVFLSLIKNPRLIRISASHVFWMGYENTRRTQRGKEKKTKKNSGIKAARECRAIAAPLQTERPSPPQRLRAFLLALRIHTLMHQGHFSFKHGGGGGFYDATLERKTDREDKGGGGKECGRMKMEEKSSNAEIKQMTYC